MRWAIAVLLLLSGCIGFHPLHPEWDKSEASGEAADASARLALADVADIPWQVIGHSHQGRPLRIKRIGNGPRRVIWVGGIHGNEREGVISTRELPMALARLPGALAQVTLTILEDVNPDGTALNQRGNAKGIDLNRNYPANNFLAGKSFGERPLDQPEAQALHDLVRGERPHLVIVAHSWRDDHFINFDGPAVQLAELFSEHSGYRVKPSDLISPTPGSLGSWIGRTLGIPILTLEHHRGADPLACWLNTRQAILSVILAG
jgi:murein peptide amidase A